MIINWLKILLTRKKRKADHVKVPPYIAYVTEKMNEGWVLRRYMTPTGTTAPVSCYLEKTGHPSVNVTEYALGYMWDRGMLKVSLDPSDVSKYEILSIYEIFTYTLITGL